MSIEVYKENDDNLKWKVSLEGYTGGVELLILDAVSGECIHKMASITKNGIELETDAGPVLIEQGYTTQGIPFDEDGRIKLYKGDE